MATVKRMDLDALTAARRAEWARLDELSRVRHPSGAQVDELVTRYRAASADLAEAKTSAGRSIQADHISTILSRARLRLTGASENPMRQIPRFFALQLPAALYRVRWATLAIAVGFVLVAAITAFWVSADPALVATLASEAQLRQIAEETFTEYYRDGTSPIFAGTVWTNNAWLAAQCVIFGVTGIYPIAMLVANAVSIGSMAAILMTFDRGDIFLLYIAPHGLLELTSIFVAAAAGLQIFWAWVAPGPRTRGEALAAAGRSLATIAIGLVFALAVSGAIEGFVTARPWPWPVKIGIGAMALALFLVYMLVVGRRAYRLGETGDLTEYEAGTPTLAAG